MRVRNIGEAESQFSDVLERYRAGEATQAEMDEAAEEQARWDRYAEIDQYRAHKREERQHSQMQQGH